MQAVILCPTCRHQNDIDVGFCGNCWKRLDDSPTISKGEADALHRRWVVRRRLRRWVRWGAAGLIVLLMVVGVLYQYGAFASPLPPPSSDISAVSAPGDWAMYLHDPTHSASALDAGATADGRLKWRFDTDAPLTSSPAVVDGRLYLGSGDKRIVALDAEDGTLLWEYPSTGPVDSSPAVAGGSVFVGLRDGRVLALDAVSGELQWEYLTGGIFATSPVVLEGILYIGSGDGKLYTLDALTGEERWAYQTAGHIASDPAINDEIVAVLSQDNYLHIVDKQTGRKRLDYHAKFARGTPVLSGNRVYTADGLGIVTAVDWRKRELPLEKKVRWVRTQMWAWGLGDLPPLKGLAWAAMLPGNSFVGAPIVSGDRLYVASEERRLHSLDSETGDVVWTFQTDGWVSSPPTLAKESVLIADKFGVLYAVDADTGAEIWRFEAGSAITTSPVAANGMLYITSEDGSLYALE